MSIVRGLILLAIVAGLFTAALHQIVPHSVATPRRAMETAIDIYDKKGQRPDDAWVDQAPLRHAGDRLAPATPSPLQAIMIAHGFACDTISGAEVVPGREAAYLITCRSGTNVARYRVDTRLNLAEPA